MSETNDQQNRTITIQRTFDAPIAMVWEAWTNAEHIVKWWGPKGMKTEIVFHDFKVGGKWKYVMAMSNGRDFIAEGEYQHIEEPYKLVTTANFLPMTEGVIMEVFLKANGDQTDFTFNVIHPTEEYKLQQEKMGVYNGWGSVFNQLAEFLANQIINQYQRQNKKKMKTMTCKQLGGACDLKFQAETFEEIAEKSKQHGMEMYQKGDEAHLKAMDEMQELMKSPEKMQEWFEGKRKEFEVLPED